MIRDIPLQLRTFALARELNFLCGPFDDASIAETFYNGLCHASDHYRDGVIVIVSQRIYLACKDYPEGNTPNWDSEEYDPFAVPVFNIS
jgi:hypothetical protein